MNTIILITFIGLKSLQHILEEALAFMNRSFFMDQNRQKEASQVLQISEDDMTKTVNYSLDKFTFARISGWISFVVTMAFIALGGLGLFENWAISVGSKLYESNIIFGLLFFLFLGIASMIFNIPFDLYSIFRIEERHGFNKQTLKGFFLDRIKGLLIGIILGGLILALILYIMEKLGGYWWVYAWIAVTGFSLLTVWIYPTLLAPLFNKFKPIEEGELKEKIYALADKIGFKTNGLFVMDASKRSTHGNAYFTGLWGKKRIVLFDTLIESMSTDEIVAVLGHELGHFKLHHIRWQLIRGIFMTGIMFFLLSLTLPLTDFYTAFSLSAKSSYGALIVFGLWFGLVDFLLQPFESYLSRRNEFAADRFATKHLEGCKSLGDALLKLREKSHVMPISHPLFSAIYHSHPPMFERLKSMGYLSLKDAT